MTREELREAMEQLGRDWDLDRPLFASELGRACRLEERNPGRAVRGYLKGARIPGPVAAIIDMMLKGAPPADGYRNVLIKKNPYTSHKRKRRTQ